MQLAGIKSRKEIKDGVTLPTGEWFNKVIQDRQNSGISDCNLIERLQIMDNPDLSILLHYTEPLGTV